MKKIAAVILSGFFILSVFSFALAEDGSNAGSSGSGDRETAKERLETKKLELEDRIATRAAIRKEKLEQTKLKVCETHQEIIKKRSVGIGKRALNQFSVFQSIADRVDAYYNNKLVPAGIIVPNYDALKADMADKQAAAQAAIDAAKTAAANFDCKGDDPKGQLTAFKETMHEAIAALKDYRTSIRNFIVAIKTAKAASEASSSAKTED